MGRTAVGAMVYDEDVNELLSGLRRYTSHMRTSPETGSHTYFKRYPKGEGYAAVGSSRDHVIYWLSTMVQLNLLDKSFIKIMAKRPCIDHPYTLGQKLMFKGLFSNFWSWVYAITVTPMNLLNMGLNRLSRPLFKKEVYPTYAPFYILWGIQALQSKSAKKYMQKLLCGHFEKSNYVAQMLCGNKVSKEDVENYVPTRKNRWTTRLDGTSDRDLTLYPDEVPGTNLELDLLWYLYEKQEMD